MIDLSNSQLLAGAGVAVGSWLMVGRQLIEKLQSVFSQGEPTSDSPAPAGFSDHVAAILAACPSAPAEVRLEYLSQGLSEVETLRAEIGRLFKQVTPEGSSQ